MIGIPSYLFETMSSKPLALLVDNDLEIMITMRETVDAFGWRVMPLAHWSEVYAIPDFDIFMFIVMGRTASTYDDIAVLHKLAEHGITAPVVMLEDEVQTPREAVIGDGIMEAGLNYQGRVPRTLDPYVLQKNLNDTLPTVH